MKSIFTWEPKHSRFVSLNVFIAFEGDSLVVKAVVWGQEVLGSNSPFLGMFYNLVACLLLIIIKGPFESLRKCIFLIET